MAEDGENFKDWPYFDQYLRQYPDPEQIDAQGRSLLYRSLNIGHVIAAIGSGVSMNYGSVSWGHLALLAGNHVSERLALILKAYLEILETPVGADNLPPDHVEQVKVLGELKAKLQSVKAIGDTRPDTDFATSAIQLCESVDSHLTSLLTNQEINDRLKSEEREAAKRDLRTAVADWMAGEAGATTVAEVLAGTLPARAPRLPKELRQDLDAHVMSTEAGGERLLPFHRHAMRVLGESPFEEGTYTGPLALLFDKLNIRRFVTTNYDSGITAMLADEGYENTQGDARAQHDTLGTPSRIMEFSTAEPAHLIDFSIFDKTGRVDTIHLHGRAAGGTSNLVMTEADYQARYASEGVTRELADDALSILFNANPVLFIGAGMTEEDTLSPLRRFNAQSSTHRERPAVALMAKNPKKSAQRKIRNYLRYRVHVLDYGVCQVGHDEVAVIADIVELVRCGDELVKAMEAADAPPVAGVTGANDEKKKRVQKVQEAANAFTRCREASPLLSGSAGILSLEHQGVASLPTSLRRQLEHFQRSLGIYLLAGDELAKRRPTTRAGYALRKFVQLWGPGLATLAQGLSLNAFILSLHSGWQAWRTTWRAMPIPRATGGGGPESKTFHEDGPLCTVSWMKRHPSALHPEIPGLEMKPPAGDRFFHGAPSQSYATFLGALMARRDQWRAGSDRRVFACIANRGTGKGHFFESFHDARRLRKLAATLNPNSAEGSQFNYALTNLSHGHEVAAAFDRLTNWLVMQAKGMFCLSPKDWMAKVVKPSQSLAKHRIRRLHVVLDTYACLRDGAKGRTTIVLNGFNVLFDHAGHAKNGQLHALVSALFSAATKRAPIDFILISEASSFPFRRAPEHRSASATWPQLPEFVFSPLVREDISPRGQERIDAVLRSLDLPLVRRKGADARVSAFVHVIREARAPALVAAFFPLAGALRAAAELGWSSVEVNAADLRRAVRNFLTVHAHNFDEITSVGSIGAVLANLGPPPKAEGIDTFTLDALKVSNDIEERFRNRQFEAVPSNNPWTRTFRIIGGGRYLFSLILAAIEADAVERPGLGNLQYSAVRARALIAQIEGAVANRSDSAKAEVLLGIVFAVYKEAHERECGVTSDSGVMLTDLPHEVTTRLAGPKGWRLQLKILRLCAMIGQPVEAHILARNREVSTIARKIVEGTNAKAEIVVVAATDLLVHRCLLFRIAPVGEISGSESWIPLGDKVDVDGDENNNEEEEKDANGANEWRFAVHRLLQRSIFKRMNAPLVEYSHVDQYTLSMFVSQPSDVPRPSVEAIREISDYVAELTRLPRSPAEAISLWSKNRSVTLPSRDELRAALGLLKSIYSAGVISRFTAAEGDAIGGHSGAGYFEDHRRRLRWLLRQGTAVSGGLQRKYSHGLMRHQDTARSPFFAEEVVWLFNESGLMSLIEGRLNDATALFDQALAAAQRIEPDLESGPLWTRIHLNKAYVDIERGNSRAARSYLSRIVSKPNEHPVMRLSAMGFLGLIDHLAGEFRRAIDKYKASIDGLLTLERSRAAAIFSRHLADLYRAKGPEHREEASQTFKQALALAAHGGHEDIRQITLLARTRLSIDSIRDAPHEPVLRDIESVEGYAQRMGMPRLMAEAAFNRAKLLFSLGETRHAAKLARVSLEIATENDMRLRQIAALLLISRIYASRDQESLSRPILQRALQLADDAEYHNVRGQIARSLGHMA